MLPRDVTVYLAIAPVDLRAGFDRLSGIVMEHLRCDPRVGNLYVFTNRRRTHAKVLFYDRTGYCVLFKRLDRGHFPLPTVIEPGASGIEISGRELELLLQGIDVAPRRRAGGKKTTSDVH